MTIPAILAVLALMPCRMCGGDLLGGGPIEGCLDLDEVSRSERKAIDEVGRQVMGHMKDGAWDELFKVSHVMFQDAFLMSTPEDVRAMIPGFLVEPDELELQGLLLFDVPLEGQQDMYCGSTVVTDPEHLAIRTLGPKGRTAIATYRYEKKPFTWDAVLQLVKMDEGYRLLRFDILPRALDGKDATHWEKRAEYFHDEGEGLTAVACLTMASLLGESGQNLASAQFKRINARVLEVEKAHDIASYLDRFMVGEQAYYIVDMINMGPGDLTMKIRYISQVPLTPGSVEPEIQAIHDALLEKNPSLVKELGTLGIEACDYNPLSGPYRSHLVFYTPEGKKK